MPTTRWSTCKRSALEIDQAYFDVVKRNPHPFICVLSSGARMEGGGGAVRKPNLVPSAPRPVDQCMEPIGFACSMWFHI